RQEMPHRARTLARSAAHKKGEPPMMGGTGGSWEIWEILGDWEKRRCETKSCEESLEKLFEACTRPLRGCRVWQGEIARVVPFPTLAHIALNYRNLLTDIAGAGGKKIQPRGSRQRQATVLGCRHAG